MELTALVGLLVTVMGRWFLERRKLREKIRSLGRRRRLILAMSLLGRPKKLRRPRRSWKFIRGQTFWEKDVPQWPDDKFHSVFRMSRATFGDICENLSVKLHRNKTTMRDPLSVKKRVAIAIFYLKSGADYGVVAIAFGIGKSTVCKIVDEFCDAIEEVYNNVIKFPTTEEEQEEMASGFMKSWQFPNTLSAIDGSHIPIITPEEFGEDYYNYKGWHSVVLMAAVDYKYRFTYINVGSAGRSNDAAVFQTSSLHRRINEGLFDRKYHIIGDGAFPLSPFIMKPFIGNNLEQRRSNFNYRLSRARMVVECAFGRLKGRWRVLLKRGDTKLEKTVRVISTCVILHNLCENANELFRQEWLEPVQDFDNMYLQPNVDIYNWDGMDGQAKRNALVEAIQQIPLQ